jgi:hypothetical protein
MNFGESWGASYGKWIHPMMMCTIIMLLKWIKSNILRSRVPKGGSEPVATSNETTKWVELLGLKICRSFASHKLVTHPSGGHVQQTLLRFSIHAKDISSIIYELYS